MKRYSYDLRKPRKKNLLHEIVSEINSKVKGYHRNH